MWQQRRSPAAGLPAGSRDWLVALRPDRGPQLPVRVRGWLTARAVASDAPDHALGFRGLERGPAAGGEAEDDRPRHVRWQSAAEEVAGQLGAGGGARADRTSVVEGKSV